MDLNELLHAHQIAVMKAAATGDVSGRDNHFAKVAEYADRVRQLREIHQMGDTPRPTDAPETIIYGSYAGDAEKPASKEAVQDWEGEGGAIASPVEPVLPPGVTSKLVREYRVGSFVYQDLDLALAEHLRQMSAESDDGEADADLAQDE